ncbi:MAG: YggS family pyridoxal phosphate-dependent enzyme [Deltaproteobacteria bacterium]|nr:MAG: YggS family pyridoxal phosphate-dependent enzyme [Deltaproteobacteria bacterium]
MLEKNLANIKHRIKKIATRVNRSSDDIKLVAVSKRISSEKVIKAIDLGQLIFGENYVQEANDKIPFIKSTARQNILFHFIGKLQSNKAKKAAELFDVIETVDSIKLGLALDKQCANLNKSLTAYIQVNIAREKQKSGVQPEECEKILHDLAKCNFLRITGLMTMPPFFADPEEVRPFFKQLRQLSEELTAKGLLGHHGPVELSMGMSGDFEVAIEEGATVVRVGTAIFGTRDQ